MFLQGLRESPRECLFAVMFGVKALRLYRRAAVGLERDSLGHKDLGIKLQGFG